MNRTLKRLHLLRGLFNGQLAYTGPFYVRLDLTRRCNSRCMGCPYHTPGGRGYAPADLTTKDISLELVRDLAEELAIMHTPEVSLIGEGEPLLHPKLGEIIMAFKEKGLKVEVVTNGILLEEKAKLLMDTGLDELKITLWVNSIEEYHQAHPGTDPTNFERVLRGLKFLSELKRTWSSDRPKIALRQPLTCYNYETIHDRVELATAMACNSVIFSVFRDFKLDVAPFALSNEQIRWVSRVLKNLAPRLDSIGLEHNITEVLCRYRMGKEIWRRIPCYVGWFYAMVKADGSVFPCNTCYLPMGNLKLSSFREIWNDQAYRGFRCRSTTASGLESLSNHCYCDYCCFLGDNSRIHNIFKPLRPISLLRARTEGGKR